MLTLTNTIDGQPSDRGGTVSFRCTCYATGHQRPWTVVVDVDFPGGPLVAWV